MTVTLTYDPTLARVRLSADALGAADVATVERSIDQLFWTTVRGGVEAVPFVRGDVRDTFTRSVSPGWGTPDVGPAWTVVEGPAADATVSGNVGRLSLAAPGTGRSVEVPVSLADVDITIENITFPVLPTASSPGTANPAQFVRARYVDGSNFLEAQLFRTDTNITSMRLAQTVAGVETAAPGAFTAIAGASATSTLSLRLQASGSLCRMKVWLSGQPQPAAWSLQFTTTMVSAGSVRIRTDVGVNSTNTFPLVPTWDNITVGPRVVELDDYEFVSGKPNFYRVRGVETGAISFVAAGSAAAGNNAPVAPGSPTGLLPGDLKVLLASIRNSGTGTVDVPAGWTLMRQFGNVSLLGRKHLAGDAAPTVTFTGGVANATTIGFIAAFRRADLAPVTGADQLNGSAASVAYPALTVPQDNELILWAGWHQSAWGGASTPPPGATLAAEFASALGDDASQVLDYLIQGAKANITAGSIGIVGGAAISRAMVVALQHAPFLNEQTASTTPVLDSIWIKSVMRPFLNRKVTVVDWSPEERPARSGGFPAVGRTLEVAVTDVAGGIVFDLDLHVSNLLDAQTLDYIRASGDILFLHTPAGCPVPGGHVCVDTSSARRIRPRGAPRVFTLPLRQCAAPGPDVVGATSSWTTVLSSYASWPAVLAANPTWADLRARIAPPSEVIVP